MAKKDEKLREAKIVETPENDSDVYIPDDSMMMMNEGQAFHEDPEIKEEKDKEKAEDEAMFKGDHPLVQAVFEWMDGEVEGTDSVKFARTVAEEYKLDMTQAIAVCDIVAKTIQFKRTQFQNIFDSVNKKDDTIEPTETDS